MPPKSVVPLFILCLSPTLVLAQNAAATVAVDAGANRRPINPHIYGLAFASTSDLAATASAIQGGSTALTSSPPPAPPAWAPRPCSPSP